MPKNELTHQKKPARGVRQQFVIWSYDDASQQIFVDIESARSSKEAESKVVRKRPCALLDSEVKPILLTEYIAYLQKEVKA